MRKQSWVVLAAFVVAACAGCPQQPAKEKPEPSGGPPAAERPAAVEAPAEELAAAAPKVEEPPPPLTIPKVELSDADRATCLVEVGQPLPQAELPDLGGAMHPLESLRGEKLTVVFFWAGGETAYGKMSAATALEDLQKDVAEPYAERGVRVVGVNVGETTQAAAAIVGQAGAKFPTLRDSDGAYFAKVAAKKMPRTYLLDAEGNILWFDLEYSRSTRRDLMQAVGVALGEM